MNPDQLLDQIFGDPRVKHKLDLFTPREKDRLQIFEKGGKLRIRCLVRDRDFAVTPEEVVRQLALIRLHYTLGYELDRLTVEVRVQMGSGMSSKAADIVVYRDSHKLIPYIVIEVKKPGRKDGREQLHSYMNANGAPFGMWTNGGSGKQNMVCELRTDPNLFAELPRLPAQGESLDDVLEPIRKKDLQPAEDLIGLVMQMQEEVLANAGVNVFEEVFKLFFIKLWDEENVSDNPHDDRSICRFRRTADPPEQQYPRFKRLLDEATAVYPDIFPPGTDFDLSPEALLVAVSVLERIRLSDTDLELIDLTFEYLMSPESKGDKGQYFTPRQVGNRQFDLMMTNPPFAGIIRHPQILSSYDLGFTETLTRRKSRDEITIVRERRQVDNQTRDVLFLDYCLNKLRPGGRMAIVLPQGNFNNISAEPIRRYVMSQARILAVVGLEVNTFKPHTGTKTSVLFAQRWAGQAADDWATWYEAVRAHEAAVAEYRALRDWRETLLRQGTPESALPDQIRLAPTPPGDPPAPPSDYPIFFATSRRSGRDNSGRYDYRKDGNGQLVMAAKQVLAHDEAGQPIEIYQDRPVLNTDLDEIAEAFVAWAQAQGLDFFAPSPAAASAFADVVAGADLNISSVIVSDLEPMYRLDAECYQPHYLQHVTAVSTGDLLKRLTKITHPVEIKRLYEDEGIQILLAQNIRNNRLDFSTTAFMPLSTQEQLSRNKLRFDDVVMTRSGANFGDTAVYKGEPDNIYACADVLVIRPHGVRGGYLATYFNTKIGRALVTRGAYGMAQPHIAPNYLYRMSLPRLEDIFEREIDDLVSEAYAKEKMSKILYRQAEQLLLDELGLRDLELADELCGEAKLTEVWTAQRLDTDYFERRYNAILDHLANYSTKSVGDVAILRQKRFVPQQNILFDYIEISDVDLSNGLCASTQLPGDEVPERAQQIVHSGDVIVSTVRPLRGGTALIRPEQDGFVCSSGFAVIRSTAICTEYLLTYLRLKSIRELINRANRASMYPAVIPQDILKIPIILLPQIEDKVQAKIQQSHQAHFDGLKLLEQAKRKVETMIESEAVHG